MAILGLPVARGGCPAPVHPRGDKNCVDFYLPVNEEWLEGQCNGKVGIFPSAFVQKSNAGDPEV